MDHEGPHGALGERKTWGVAVGRRTTYAARQNHARLLGLTKDLFQHLLDLRQAASGSSSVGVRLVHQLGKDAVSIMKLHTSKDAWCKESTLGVSLFQLHGLPWNPRPLL